MLIIQALEAVCDLLPYFAFAALFPAYENAGQLVGMELLLVCVSAMMLARLKNPVSGFICGLLPILGLMSATSREQILFTIPALIIWCALAISGKNDVHYEDYKYLFGVPAALDILILLFILSKVLSGEHMSRISILCASSYLVLGVIVLRRKRMGASATLQARMLNLAEILGVSAAGVVSIGLIYGVLKLLWKVIEIILLPFGLLFNALVSFFVWVTPFVMNNQPVEETAASEAVSVLEEEIAETESLVSEVDPAQYPWAETLQHIIVVVFIIVLFVFIGIAIYKMVKELRIDGRSYDQHYEDAVMEKEAFGKKKRRKRRKEERTNNYKIREIYREYLAYIRKNGVSISGQATSEEILEASNRLVDSSEAAGLRALYIRARYNDEKQLSSEEVSQAKQLWNIIREEYENRDRA